MQNMVKIMKCLMVLIMFTFSSCYSGPNPIIIRDIPRAVITEDMSTDAYIYESTRWAIEVKAYVEELINQCIHKVPTIDLRKEIQKNEQ